MSRHENERHGKIWTSFTMGILSVIITGLIYNVGNILWKAIPALSARVQVIESQRKEDKEDLKRIDSKVDKIIDILMERR